MDLSNFTGMFNPVLVDVTIQDLSMNENVGVRTTQYIQQSLGCVPHLRDLVILFKAYLAALGLNNAYKGMLFSHEVVLAHMLYVC